MSDRVLEGVDAARRAAWAKFYELEQRVDRAEALLDAADERFDLIEAAWVARNGNVLEQDPERQVNVDDLREALGRPRKRVRVPR